MNNNQWGVLSLKTVYHEKEEAATVPAPVLTREREKKKGKIFWVERVSGGCADTGVRHCAFGHRPRRTPCIQTISSRRSASVGGGGGSSFSGSSNSQLRPHTASTLAFQLATIATKPNVGWFALAASQSSFAFPVLTSSSKRLHPSSNLK